MEPGGCLQKTEAIGFGVKWEAENETPGGREGHHSQAQRRGDDACEQLPPGGGSGAARRGAAMGAKVRIGVRLHDGEPRFLIAWRPAPLGEGAAAGSIMASDFILRRGLLS